VAGFSEQLLVAGPVAPGGRRRSTSTRSQAARLPRAGGDHQDRGRVVHGSSSESRRRCCCPRSPGHSVEAPQRGVHHQAAARAARLPLARRWRVIPRSPYPPRSDSRPGSRGCSPFQGALPARHDSTRFQVERSWTPNGRLSGQGGGEQIALLGHQATKAAEVIGARSR